MIDSKKDDMNHRRSALIIGASRGLGWGLAREYLRRGWTVTATVRGDRTNTPLHSLLSDFPELEIEQVDINEVEQVAALRARIGARHFDLLFVNAGVSNDPAVPIGDVDTEEFTRIMITNALSPMRVIERIGEVVNADGTIAVMSSELGSVTDNVNGGWEAYRASKAALNTLMRSYAARTHGDGRSLFVVAPGWVRTAMGGPAAPLDIDTSIPGVVDALEARRDTTSLAFINYRNEELPW